MVLLATEEKERGRPSPGKVLTAITGEVTGVWKSIAANRKKPMHDNARAFNEHLFWDIGKLLFCGKTARSTISDFNKSFKRPASAFVEGQ
jgi:hypothetical protein